MGARDGAKSVVSDYLQELNGYIVSAANTSGQTREEREALQVQVDKIIESIDFLALTSTFNNQALLAGDQAANLGVFTEPGTKPDGTPTTVRYSLADLRTGGKLNLIDGDLSKSQTLVKDLTNSYAQQRADLGARAQQIDSEIEQANTEYINLTDAQSQIEDTDYAKEVSALVRAQVLQQAAAFAIRLSQQSGPQQVLGLLKPLEPNGA